MALIDYFIFVGYLIAVFSVGIYFYRKNKSTEDYYVGGRNIKPLHVGLSVVATDVGGGFSIGLGGVGFTMGLAGSWLLFTGLIGAWMSAVFIIPKIKQIDVAHGMMTYPDFLKFRYGKGVALAAAVISGIGYLGFSGGQILAGAKLASATVFHSPPFGMNPLTFSLVFIGLITVLYTCFGGLKAVIYTDTIQWILLLIGLIVFTVPAAIYEMGGFNKLTEKLPSEFFSLTNIEPVTFINWMVTIIPIWLIGMTLYQRMYACKTEKDAKKAWFYAGLFEYPTMAFAGVFLGMCGRYFFPDSEPEMALPMLIRDILPIGITGIVISAYFSAIMSTADSCLLASSGNWVNDIFEPLFAKKGTTVKASVIGTLIVGMLAILLSLKFQNVLDIILYSYAFMVSGLFIPTLGAYFWKKGTAKGALASMMGGGTLTLLLTTGLLKLPENLASIGLDASVYGITTSLVLYVGVSLLSDTKKENSAA